MIMVKWFSLIILLLFFSTPSFAASYSDENGVTHYTNKGQSTGHQADQSDYYLNVRPLQTKIDNLCAFAASDMGSVEYDYLESMIEKGSVLINDFPSVTMADNKLKASLEKQTLECQKTLLVEKKRRWTAEYIYATQKAAESRRKAAEWGRIAEQGRAYLREREERQRNK